MKGSPKRSRTKTFKKKSKKISGLKKRRSRSKKNSQILKTMIGFLGASASAGILKIIKDRLGADYGKKIIYEENNLVPGNSNVVFEDVKYSTFPKYLSTRSDNWETSKEKKEIPNTLYETIEVKLMNGINKPLENFTEIEFPFKKVEINNNTGLPTYFIVNIQLPPFGPEFNKIYYSVVIYYKIKKETIEIANNANENYIHNSITMLSKFITNYNEFKDRFKGILKINDITNLGLGIGNNSYIDQLMKLSGIDKKIMNQHAVILNDTAKHFKKADNFEMDIDVSKFKTFFDISKVANYYDKLNKIDADVGFVIEGRKNDELPEILIGQTKIKGIIFDNNEKIEKNILNDKIIIDKIPFLIKDEKAVIMGNKYAIYIKNINLALKNQNPDSFSIISFPSFSYFYDNMKDKRNTGFLKNKALVNRNIFLYARYFYYLNYSNPNYKLKSNLASIGVDYSAENIEGIIAKGTCFENESIYNFYKCKSDFTSFRFGISIKNVFDKTNFTELVLNKMNSTFSWLNLTRPKKFLVVSLLTPCNTTFCKTIKSRSKILPKRAYISFMESEIIDIENKKFNELGHLFINIPLSSNMKGTMFKEGVKSVRPETVTNFQNLIDISTPEKTFKTLVNVTKLFYEKYKNNYIFCYHCKSGLDRTGIFDSVVKSTVLYITSSNDKEFSEQTYETIRKNCIYFLMYSYMITFYSRGIPGIKINNIPVAKYILNDPKTYDFFLGNSKLSNS